MVFEDLIKRKTATTFNTTKQCPHCRAYAIIKYLVQGVIGGKKKQEVYCPSCARRWYIVYDVDMKNAHIEFIAHKPSVTVAP